MYLSMIQQRSRLLASGLSITLLVAAGVGCSNSTTTNNSNGSSGVSCTPPPSSLPSFSVPQGPPAITGGFGYAVKTSSHKVVWYKVESSGVLTSRGEICAGFQPTFIAANSTRKLAYVTNFSSDTVSAYTIGTDGALAALGSPVPAGNGPASINVDWTRNLVYVTNFESDSISVYEIDSSNGTLTRVQDLQTGLGPDAIAGDSTGKFVYVASFKSDTLSVYRVNEATRRLDTTPIATYNVRLRGENGPNALTITGSFLYVTSEESDTVSAYSIKTTGELESLGGPLSTGNGPEGVTVDTTGKFAYVADGQADTISIYTIGANGVLQAPRVSISTLPARDPEGIMMDSVTNTIFVVNRETNDVSAYKISDATTGALALLGHFPL